MQDHQENINNVENHPENLNNRQNQQENLNNRQNQQENLNNRQYQQENRNRQNQQVNHIQEYVMSLSRDSVAVQKKSRPDSMLGCVRRSLVSYAEEKKRKDYVMNGNTNRNWKDDGKRSWMRWESRPKEQNFEGPESGIKSL